MNLLQAWRRFAATTRARTLEFLRDRSALSWNLIFPVLLVAGFAVVFSGPERPLFTVAVAGEGSHPLLAAPGLRVERVDHAGREAAITRVARQRIDMAIELPSADAESGPGAAQGRYWVNPTAQSGALLEHLLESSGGPVLERAEVTGEPIRYVDWVLPGVLAINVMFSSLWGVGYGIVRYRKNGYLKRLHATPLSAFEFISAQLVSRLMLVMTITALMYLGCQWLIGFRMEGRALDLFVVALIGSVAMIAMGLVIAARVNSEELASGLLNIFSWPMLVLSGVFYAIDVAPVWVQHLAGLLPLTHVLDAARAIMLDGASLWAVRDSLLALVGLAAALLALGAALFKWAPDA